MSMLDQLFIIGVLAGYVILVTYGQWYWSQTQKLVRHIKLHRKKMEALRRAAR